MGKTNRKRAKKCTEILPLTLEFYVDSESYIKFLDVIEKELNKQYRKGVKDGQRKERKWWQKNLTFRKVTSPF